MRRGVRISFRIGFALILVLMLLTPTMPWLDARMMYGLAPWVPNANESPLTKTFRFENRPYSRETPTPRVEVGFEQGRFKVGFADVPPTSAPNEIGKDYAVLSIAGHCLFTYHIRRHGPWTPPSIGPVRWRMGFVDPQLLACLLAIYPAWRGVRRWRKRWRRVDSAVRWSLRLAPLVAVIALWTTSTARTNYATGLGRTLVQFMQPGVSVGDFASSLDVHWDSEERIPGRVRGGDFHGFQYYSNGMSWGYVSTPYAALAALATLPLLPSIFRMIKRRRQSRRLQLGQCPDCGYDLRGSAERCPECGKEIEHPSAVTPVTVLS